jgi:hypothetical protein
LPINGRDLLTSTPIAVPDIAQNLFKIWKFRIIFFHKISRYLVISGIRKLARRLSKTFTMTISGTHKPNWKIAIGIPLIIFSSCFFITLTTKFKANPELLSNAILINILVVAPLIYLLAIRKSIISQMSVSRVFIAGLFVAGLILNVHSNPFLQIIKTWVSPLIELVVISFIVSKFYIANKKAKQINTFSTSLKIFRDAY